MGKHAKSKKAAGKAGKDAGKAVGKNAGKAVEKAVGKVEPKVKPAAEAAPARPEKTTGGARLEARIIAGLAKHDGGTGASFSEALAVHRGFELAQVDPESTPGFSGGKDAGAAALAARAKKVGDLQERLSAEAKSGVGSRGMLLVIQGMDTAGKGGIMRHVVGEMDPEGVRPTAFKAPTKEELSHDFLWRIRNALGGPGKITVFDRSHYEDVLIARVRELVPRAELQKRYALINAFERRLIAGGTEIVKVMLHISKDEQKARLAERLDRPDKFYKFNPGDIDEREHWDEYMQAYQIALTRCSTVGAPWHVVPANRKWYARLAVQELVLEKLAAMDPQWPAATFDVEAEKARLAQS